MADRSGPATAAVHHAALARSHAALGNILAAGHHAARSAPLLDPGLCASLLLAGATAALDVGRIDDAARWFELAATLPGLDPSQRLDARIGLGATLLGMGDPRGREEIEATRRDALRGRRWPQAADAICRGTRLGDPVDTEAVRNFTTTAESVLDGLAQSDPLRSTRLLSQLVHAHVLRDVPAAAEYLRRLEQLPPCNEVGAAAEVHVVQQVCAYRLEVVAHPAEPGHLSAGAALRATFEREGALVAAVLTATIEVAAHLQVGTPVPGSVRAAIEGGAERLGRPDLLLALELADLGVTIGSEPLDAADLRLGEVLALATQLGTAPAVLFHTIALRREQLRAAELLPLVMAMGVAAPGPSVDVVASICLREQDETEAAADRLELATSALVAGRTDWTAPGAAALVLDESSSVGAPLTDTAADRCASLLAPHHGAMLLVAQVGMHLGPADRYLALAAAARGDLRRFDQLNRDATALARTAGLTNWAAWCELDRLRGGLDDVDVAALRRTARRHGAARLLQQLDLLTGSR